MDTPGSKTVDLQEVRKCLSKYVEQAAAGCEIIILKAGMPIARLIPMAKARRPIKFGVLKGRLNVPDDFDAPLDPKMLAFFTGD